jgi:RNA polymerase sigma-70 factor (ECF subfamily)
LDGSAKRSVEGTCLPHLRAAYNLARWLARDEHDAEDLVQEAYLRAIKYCDSAPQIGNARAWLLKIVRNTFYTSRSQKRPDEEAASFDEAVHTGALDPFNPETKALREADRELVHAALLELGAEFREALVLRELEGLSYREIGEVVGAPVGTVMSRLSRARKALAEALARHMKERSA